MVWGRLGVLIGRIIKCFINQVIVKGCYQDSFPSPHLLGKDDVV